MVFGSKVADRVLDVVATQDERRAAFPILSKREYDVLEQLAAGRTNHEIARRPSNPLAVQITAALTPAQITDTREVLDGMLRERSGGSPSAVLTAAMNIGTGTV